MAERKAFLLRVPPELHTALEKWAADELRSVNGQIEYLLATAVKDAGRAVKPRPPRADQAPAGDAPRADEAPDSVEELSNMPAVMKHRLSSPILLLILAIAIAAAVASGCQRMEKFGKHWESGMDGLDRTISLYSREGALMGRWTAKTYVEARRGDGMIAFLDSAGHEVKLVGGIIVVQEN